MSPFLFISAPVALSMFLAVVCLLIYALALVGKEERNLNLIVWIVVLIFVPIVGSLAYILKYYMSKREVKLAQ